MKFLRCVALCLIFSSSLAFAEVFKGYTMQLNGVAALVSGGSTLRVSNTSGGVGSAFIVSPFLIDANTSFSTFFQFRIGDGSGADGLVFVVHNDSGGAGTTGAGGGGLGYRDIDNSLGVEIDEWVNAEWSDPNANHLGIDLNGSPASVVTFTPGVDVDSGTSYYLWVDYDGLINQLSVYFNTSASKPGSASMTYTLDLASVAGSKAYVGFVSSTGGANNNHDVEEWTLTWTGPEAEPVPSLKFWALALLALLLFGVARYHLVLRNQ